MNIRIARRTLMSFRAGKQTMAIRVASRWLQANMAYEYDRLFRLQLLEGAAGVSSGSWWKTSNSKRALKTAQENFEGTNILPDWFIENQNVVYGILTRNITNAIRSMKARIETDDVIQAILSNTPLDSSTTHKDTDPTAYTVGRYLAKTITNGKDTPESIAKGMLTNYIKQKIQNTTRRQHESLPTYDDGSYKDFGEDQPGVINWGKAEQAYAAEYLSNIMFYDINDPLGKDIRQFMRDTWSSRDAVNRGIYMNHWLDSLESRKPLSFADMSRYFEITKTGFRKHWDAAWKQFFEALWKNTSLMAKINNRLRKEYLEPLNAELPKDALNQVLVNKFK